MDADGGWLRSCILEGGKLENLFDGGAVLTVSGRLVALSTDATPKVAPTFRLVCIARKSAAEGNFSGSL